MTCPNDAHRRLLSAARFGLALPTARRLLDDLATCAPARAALALAEILTDGDVSAETKTALIGHPVATYLPVALVAATICELAASNNAGQLKALVDRAHHHCGPRLLLCLPAPVARRLPSSYLGPALDLRLAVADQSRFAALWGDWDGTVAELIDVCHELGET